MNELDTRIRDAFDGIVLPDQVRQNTLCAVDELIGSADASSQQTADSVQGAECIPASDRIADPMSEAVPVQPRPLPETPVAVSGSVAAVARRSHVPLYRRLGLALAACLALIAIGFGGFTMYSTETAQVGIDVNPSIELGINRFDRVVSERAVNDDGAQLLEQLSLVGKSYEEAIEALAANEAFLVYATEDSYIEINVTSDDAGQIETLTRMSDTCLQSLPGSGSCHVASAENREDALDAGMGVGRYNAALELMELDPSVTLDQCRSMTMRELRDRIIEAGGDSDSVDGGHHGQGSSSGQGEGQGAGSGSGQGQGSGAGAGQGRGQGAGQGTGQGQGSGAGQGQGAGSGQGQGAR